MSESEGGHEPAPETDDDKIDRLIVELDALLAERRRRKLAEGPDGM